MRTPTPDFLALDDRCFGGSVPSGAHLYDVCEKRRRVCPPQDDTPPSAVEWRILAVLFPARPQNFVSSPATAERSRVAAVDLAEIATSPMPPMQ